MLFSVRKILAFLHMVELLVAALVLTLRILLVFSQILEQVLRLLEREIQLASRLLQLLIRARRETLLIHLKF